MIDRGMIIIFGFPGAVLGLRDLDGMESDDSEFFERKTEWSILSCK